MRVLGIDYGDARIGIAVSDPLGWTAQGLDTIMHEGSLKKAAAEIGKLIKSYGITKIVIGLPRNMNGTYGPRAEKTISFADSLKEMFDIELVFWDERLSTVAANRTMLETGVKQKNKRKTVDRLAAVHILQGHLDSLAYKKQ